jgi:putative endonuclease
MHYVYHIQSIEFPDQIYIGYTKNLKERIACHNSKGSIYSARYAPWKLIAYHAFEDELITIRFEKYLKSQSGKAFAEKRFM